MSSRRVLTGLKKKQAIDEPGTVSESEDADGDANGTSDDAFSLPSDGEEVAISLKVRRI